MIYLVLGTKAQLIKTFPVMLRLQALGIPYRYIDTVQHGPICEELRRTFGIRAPDHFLVAPGTQIERTLDAVVWAFRVVWNGWRQRRAIFPARGTVIVHGDTLSTLVGLILARLCGQRVCHLEAGERTYKLWRPFPEEIIRRITDRWSDILLACGATQAGNLQAEGRAGLTTDLGGNTLIDAVRHATGTASGDAAAAGGAILVSIHRFETITSRERLQFLVGAIERLAQSDRVVFGVHPPTRRKLEEFGLMARLAGVPNLVIRGLLPYPDFIRAIAGCKFLLTDGGGPQEESHFLGVPCLLLRDETERSHSNVFMPGWDLAKVEWFNAHCEDFRKAAAPPAHSPSARAIEALLGPPA